MNYEVVERVLRDSVRAAGFDFTAQRVDRGERIDFAIWPHSESSVFYRPVGVRPLYVPDPLPILKDFESEQQVKECADRGLRAAARRARPDADALAGGGSSTPALGPPSRYSAV
jgi:hypothetical protein